MQHGTFHHLTGVRSSSWRGQCLLKKKEKGKVGLGGRLETWLGHRRSVGPRVETEPWQSSRDRPVPQRGAITCPWNLKNYKYLELLTGKRQ